MNSPVALITGGDSGIGFGIAEKFAAEGFRVAICGVDRRKGARALAKLPGSTKDAVYIVADVRREKQIQNLIRRAVQQFGRVGEPSDVAELAFFLASEKARQITGGVYVIDGGITAGRTRLA